MASNAFLCLAATTAAGVFAIVLDVVVNFAHKIVCSLACWLPSGTDDVKCFEYAVLRDLETS